MNKTTILDLDNKKAKKFFLDEKNYCNFDLPEYFSFQELLNKIDDYDTELTLEKSLLNRRIFPSKYEGVNYRLINNKDGEYAWRPYELVHPVLYVCLVNQITTDGWWSSIKSRFQEFEKNYVKCFSIPVLKTDKQKTQKWEQILSWWEHIEQQSIELSLEYSYIFHTDITDCYGSLYTHSIPWALHWKEVAKKERDNKLLWNRIDELFREMSYGQTNWIPQGNMVSDFIAELVLGYVDYEFTELIKWDWKLQEWEDFKILRYRDDYRIFVNNPEVGKNIVRKLTEVLIWFWMRLNSEKTIFSENVIQSSIKPGKIYHITNFKNHANHQRYLLSLHDMAIKHWNSGVLLRELSKFYGCIYSKKSFRDIGVLLSIIVDIICRCPRTYPIWVSILSKLLSTVDDDKEKIEILKKIENKVIKIPNTEYLYVFLQRLYYKIDKEKKFSWTLNQKIFNSNIEIWTSDWLENDLQKIINDTPIVDEDALKNLDAYPKREVILLFKLPY